MIIDWPRWREFLWQSAHCAYATLSGGNWPQNKSFNQYFVMSRVKNCMAAKHVLHILATMLQIIYIHIDTHISNFYIANCWIQLCCQFFVMFIYGLLLNYYCLIVNLLHAFVICDCGKKKLQIFEFFDCVNGFLDRFKANIKVFS